VKCETVGSLKYLKSDGKVLEVVSERSLRKWAQSNEETVDVTKNVLLYII